MACPENIILLGTDQKTSMIEDLQQAWRDEAFMNFKIQIKNDTLYCSKFILAARSPYMKAMLKSGMTEVTKQEVRLDNIRLDIMNIILDYMHGCDVSFHKDQLMDVIVAADYLLMTQLKDFCIDELQASQTSANVLLRWKKANRFGLSDVIQLCEAMMASNIGAISEYPEFLSLSSSQLEFYISSICDNKSQADDILEAVLKWVTHDTETRQSHLKDLLEYVDRERCSIGCIKAVLKKYASLLDQTHRLKKLAKKNDSVNDRRPQRMAHELCIVGGNHNEENHSTVNSAVLKISNLLTVEKLCDITYQGFSKEHSVCKTSDGFVITGGADSVSCMKYTSSTQSWHMMPDMPVTRHSHGSICVNETIYVLGGCTEESEIDDDYTVDMLRSNENRWQIGPELPFGVNFPKVAEINESVYLLDEITSQLLHLDVENQTWSRRAPLPWKNPDWYYPGVSMTSARGQLYVAGGYFSICAYYRPFTDTWFFLQPTIQAHIYGSLVYHNDKLILLGGNFDGGTDDVEEYTIEDDSWSMCTYKMPQGLINHCALVLTIPCSNVENA